MIETTRYRFTPVTEIRNQPDNINGHYKFLISAAYYNMKLFVFVYLYYNIV